MPQAVLGSRAYAEPPISIRRLDPQLYDYLTLLHFRLFGAASGRVDAVTREGLGDLDETNIDGALTDTTDHSLLTSLVLDDQGQPVDPHTQYLDTARHAGISGNPHAVTAAEVGSGTAQWNADRLQGQPIATPAPTLNDVLAWDGLAWAPSASAGGGGAVDSVFGRSGAVTAQAGDYSTALVTELTNLYYTDARARAALSATAPITYNPSTGVIGSSGGGAVTSVFGRTGDVVAVANDYTWAHIDKSTSSLADITTRAHSALTGLDYVSAGHTGFLQNTTDVVNDTHIDWGTGATQVNSADMPIGTPTDGSWADGINVWTTATLVADALDDCNETLSYLAPADALSMDGGTLTTSGTSFYTGKLSAGNVNYKGGDPAGSTVSYIANDAAFSILSPSQSTTFNQADEGTAKCNVNGVLNDSVNLAANFVEGERAGTQTTTPWTGAAGNLAITSVAWYNSFPKWQKGNGTVTIVPGDLRQGYNYFTLVHDGISVTQTTATLDLFYDTDAGANPSVSTPTVAENTPAWRYLSGVKMYDRASTFNIGVVGSDCFDNVYHQTSPLTYSSTSSTMGSGNITETDPAVSGLSTPPAIGETMTVTNKVLTVPSTNARSTNARLTVTPRDPYGSYTAVSSASANRLIDAYATTSSALAEYLDDENRRLPSTFDFTSTGAALTGNWTSVTILSNGNAQVYAGSLYFATVNFSSGYLPTGNPDYSTFSGNQQYWRGIAEGSGTPHSGGQLQLGGLVNADVGAVGAGAVNVEIKLPTQTGWLDLGTDYVQATFTGADGDGCRTAQSSNLWSWTCGTFSTSNSGDRYYLRVTFRNATRSITQIIEQGSGWA